MTNYFVDIEKVSGTLTGTCDFTNGSATVYGTNTLFQSELTVGDFIRIQGAGNQWYRVASIESDTELTLSWAFYQSTTTGETTDYNDEVGTSAAAAFCHVWSALVDLSPIGPGDTVFIRWNQTHLMGNCNVIIDGGGTAVNPNVLAADDGTGWPGDTQTTRPTFDFLNTDTQIYSYDQDFWEVYGFIFKNSARQTTRSSPLTWNDADGWFLEYCDFLDNNDAPAGYNKGLHVDGVGQAVIKNCLFRNNGNWNLYCDNNKLIIEDCIFDAGTENTQYGLSVRASIVIMLDCELGKNNTHTNADISYIGNPSEITARNIICYSTNKVIASSPVMVYGSFFRCEEWGGVIGAQYYWCTLGIMERDTTIKYGADSSRRVDPNTSGESTTPCSIRYPLQVLDIPLHVPNIQKTYKVYVYGTGWSGTPLLSADEFWIEAYYFDTGGSAKRAIVKSTQTLTANSTWTEYSVTVTPVITGVLYLRAFLAKAETGALLYVDIKPVIT